MWKEFNLVRLDHRARLGHVNVVALVVVLCAINIPAILATGCPTLADPRLAVDNDFGARRGKWGGIEIKLTMELCLGRERRVDARGLEQVQGEDCLWQ